MYQLTRRPEFMKERKHYGLLAHIFFKWFKCNVPMNKTTVKKKQNVYRV
jgi:hypothetical protein